MATTFFTKMEEATCETDPEDTILLKALDDFESSDNSSVSQQTNSTQLAIETSANTCTIMNSRKRRNNDSINDPSMPTLKPRLD